MILTLVSYNVTAQSKDSVKAVINKMFLGMKNVDTLMLKNCFSDSVIFQTIVVNKEGHVSVRNENVSNFIRFVGKEQKGMLDEQITFESINIDGDLASVFTPYKFFYNGKFSHCGANSFQLVRIGGHWKIQYLVDTRRKTGCD
ncbi:MAG: nuclear transport factor 2 family protein [Chitinophagaceae bacterium]|nr:nuclear transport factor 2 family protein [Chitinophagaceae bacterium]